MEDKLQELADFLGEQIQKMQELIEKNRSRMEIKTHFVSGRYTIDIISGSTVMSFGLLDQKEANEMAVKLREAADYLHEDSNGSQ